TSVDGLLKRIKESAEPPFYGSAGIGTPQHLAAELFKQKVAIDPTHVAYQGGAPAVLAVLTGEVLYSFENLALVEPHIRSGDMVAMAVTGSARTSVLPEVPTMIESGVEGFEARGWYGLLAPAGVSDAIVKRLNEAAIE